ncbi:MAG: MalY/PatB family protein [Hyphomicrobiales bacterium]
MKYKFDKIIDRRNTNCVKYDMTKGIFGRDDIIPMWVADMDFETAPEIITELEEKAKKGIYGYTFRPDSYYDAIINWQKKRHQWEIQKSWICFSPGIVAALNFIIQEFTQPQDKVIIQTPVYFMFMAAVKDNNRTIVVNELIEDKGYYTINFKELKQQMIDGAKAIILCNPHNPVGRVFTYEELKKIGELAIKYNVLIISDEIHCDIIRPGYKHIPIANISEDIANQCITTIAASKSFNLTGLSTSAVIISNPEIRKQYEKFINTLHVNYGNLFGNFATEAAFKHGEEWLNELNVYLDQNHKFLETYINTYLPQLRLIKAESTFLAWIDFSALNKSTKELKDWLVNTCKLGLSSGVDFGKGGEAYMRINIGCPRSVIEKALNRIKENI